VAEWLVGSAGLGRLFRESSVLFKLEEAWGAIVIAIIVSVGAYLMAETLERRARGRWT
jgi:NitT/TauT family transport system permease protein